MCQHGIVFVPHPIVMVVYKCENSRSTLKIGLDTLQEESFHWNLSMITYITEIQNSKFAQIYFRAYFHSEGSIV